MIGWNGESPVYKNSKQLLAQQVGGIGLLSLRLGVYLRLRVLAGLGREPSGLLVQATFPLPNHCSEGMSIA